MTYIIRFIKSVWNVRSWLLTFLFIVVVGFLDSKSFLTAYKLQQKIDDYNEQILVHKQQYEEATKALNLLGTSQEAVEKVARVNLSMKTANEDVYVVTEE